MPVALAIKCGLALTALSISSRSLSPQPESCVPNLDGLHYHTSALLLRIQGTVHIAFTVDSVGRAGPRESNAHPLLRASVEDALNKAPLIPSCSGQRVSMMVEFRFDPNIAADAAVSVKRRTEGVYEVVAPVKHVITTNLDPAWVFSRRGRAIHRIKGWLSKLRFWRQ